MWHTSPTFTCCSRPRHGFRALTHVDFNDHRMKKICPPELSKHIRDLRPIPKGTLRYTPPATEDGVNETSIEQIHPFQLGAFPVSNALWLEYVRYGGTPLDAPLWGIIPNHPVVNVSWRDLIGSSTSRGFCQWATEASGMNITLPTNHQWEYAARGGVTGRVYPWGNTFDSSKIQCSDRFSGDAKTTAPLKRASRCYINRFGLSDLSGNVLEHPLDTLGTFRCLRGGSWFYCSSDFFQCDYQYEVFPGSGFDGGAKDTFGFRICS